MAVMTGKELALKCVDIAENYRTVYLYGAPGMPVTEATITQKAAQYPNQNTPARVAKYRSLLGKGYWGFDCVNLIKAILWGWEADFSKTMGGAKYASNSVPDVNADTLMGMCKGLSTTGWAGMPVGAALGIPGSPGVSGHIGVYIGDGLAVEATPSWEDKVQITAVGNIGTRPGRNTRTWTRWGLLPWIDYSVEVKPEPPPVTPPEPPVTPPPGPSPWAAEAWEWAVRQGITDGTNPQGQCTREQVVTMMYRQWSRLAEEIAGIIVGA